MKSTDVFLTNYLKKEDITRPMVLTISHVTAEEINGEGGKERKAAMHFREGSVKPLIVNKGNWITIAEAYGDESDLWVGKPVEVYVDPSVMFGGKRVGGVRVRIPVGKPNVPVTWKYAEAVAAAAQVGIPEGALKDRLKREGFDAWYGSKCTPVIQAMITEVLEGQGEAFEPAEEKEEPIHF